MIHEGTTATEQSSLLDFYSDVADQLNTKIFLWGALVQSLVLELKDGNLFVVKELAEKTTDNRLLRSALVETIVRFGEENREQTEKFIYDLVGQLTPPPKNFFVELSRLLRPIRDDVPQDQHQKTVAVEAAMRLRFTDLLKDLAVEPSSWLRNLATQNIFYLWKQDHQVGMKILDSLSIRVRGRHGLPDLGAAASTLALTGAILGFEHEDSNVLESTLVVGRRALRRILYLNDLDQTPSIFNRFRKALLSSVYNLITGAILKFVLGIIGNWGEHTWASREGMEYFFKLSHEQKQLLKSMIPYLDYEEPGFEKRVEDIIKIEDWGDQISQAIVEWAILGRGVQDFDKALDIVQRLTEYAISYHPPRFWIGGGPMANLWQSAARIENPNPDFMALYDKVLIAIQEDPIKWVENARRDRPVPNTTETPASPLGPYLAVHYVFTKRVEMPELVLTYLEKAIEAKDDEYIAAYIQELVAIFELGVKYQPVTIAALKPIMNYDNNNVQQAIVDFLVRARNYDPDYVEDLLLRGEFPQEIADRVLTNPTSERLTDLLTYQLATIIYDLFILGPKTLRTELKWLLFKALELRNFQEFVVLIIREILNVILGEVVFNVPKDAPSRQILKQA